MVFLTRDEYMDLSDICNLLSISKATALNWIKSDTLKPVEIEGQKNLFAKRDIDALLADIKSGRISRLKSRRNKNHISGAFIPKTYIQSKEGIEVVGKIISCISTMDLAQGYERVILAEYALKLLASRKMFSLSSSQMTRMATGEKADCLLTCYLEDKECVGSYAVLIDDLLQDVNNLESQVAQLISALNIPVFYIEEQDFLGLLSMSLQNLGERKSKGVYYTPLTVVKDAVDCLKPLLHKRVKLLDPCCGSGNFLMYAYKYVMNLEGLYGYDISPLSVCLTRINMALVTRTKNMELLYRNFQCSNPLMNKQEIKFDIVIGNPPWGFNYSIEEQKALRQIYSSARAKTVESFCVFTEYALGVAVEKGIVSLILPQSILQVKIHQPIRDLLFSQSKIKRIRYWDDAFDGVQCPAITLTYEKNVEAFSLKGTEIVSNERAFTIAKERVVDRANWNFNLTDAEMALIQKIQSSVEVTYLKNQADFALGIVTGDNSKFLSDKTTHKEGNNSELIYRGSDVFKYRCSPAHCCIDFKPDKLQQVAPIELYRAKEKLIYRFIGGSLIFAYDNSQALTLNSANIVIPRIEGLSVKYILAVLNSRIAQYFFNSQFKSLKILRSQIEGIPIPVINTDQQAQIIANVEHLLESCNPGEICLHYEEIDRNIKEAFCLTDYEYGLIKQELLDTNLFLYKISAM